jgi:hypothetical protein
MNNKDSPLKVYMIVSHLSWIVISPLLFFIGGGGWLVRRYELPNWVMLVCVFLGILTMVCGFCSFVQHLLKMYSIQSGIAQKKAGTEPVKVDKRDYDY